MQGLHVDVLEHLRNHTEADPARSDGFHLAPIPRDHAVEQDKIRYRACHWTHRVPGVRYRRHAKLRITMDRGPQSDDAGERRRYPHRSTGIGADASWCESRGDRTSVAPARSAGEPCLVIGIPHRSECGVVAGDAKRKFVHVGLAQYDRPCVEQRLDDRCVRIGHEGMQTRRPGGVPNAGDVDVVLDDQRNAMQGAEVGRIAGASFIRITGGVDRFDRIHRDERVQVGIQCDLGQQRPC